MVDKMFIRVDGNDQIGLGHLVRCVALAQMLKEDFNITFVCKEILDPTRNEIVKLGFSLITINNEDSFLSALTGNEIVVIDHYGLDSTYQEKIKDKNCKLVCIDDLHNKAFFADLIINPAPSVRPGHYQAQVYTQFALGLDYVLLRPEFFGQMQKAMTDEPTQTVFVCFGGADSKNITQTVVDILEKDTRFKKIIVVTGSAYNHLDQLKRKIDRKRFALYHGVDAKKMAVLIAKAQLAIVPASGILQEVIAVGSKIISGMYVENQKYVFENYKSLGAFVSAEDFSVEHLTSAIDKAFQDRSERKILIDGKSPERLLNTFLQLAKEDAVTIRNADKNDLNKTFEWASNAEIRKFSFNRNAINFDEHKKWFDNKMRDENCFYYLGTFNNELFGSIRFDVVGDEAKISYLVDPRYQNKGLGTILLKKSLNLFVKQNLDVLSVWGEVFNKNIASMKAFQKLGYSMVVESTDFVRFNKPIRSEF
jgi:UDP-2,4-diacetamido-2,4,6-trideoxy-beta-L-altropyranose hydrolase